MNTSEGLKRIAKVVRWTGIVLASISSVIFLYEAISPVFSGGRFQSEVIGVVIITAALFYFGGKALGWVIDGFAKSKDQS